MSSPGENRGQGEQGTDKQYSLEHGTGLKNKQQGIYSIRLIRLIRLFSQGPAVALRECHDE